MTLSPLQSDFLSFPHGFFTRTGGVSEGSYASLNCGLSGGDELDRVLENRARVARYLGREPGVLLGLKQVHSDRVITVTDGWTIGQGAEADAMVTDRPGFLLGVITADCAPVLFADRHGGIVGATHAGWTGAAAGVLEATVAAMQALGSRRADIRATIGPCIQPSSYEVGEDMLAKVTQRHADDRRFFTQGRRPDHYQFDLPGYCAAKLAALDIETDIIAADTLTDEARFFSHRRRTLAGGGVIGHQISVIGL
jgi:YfiH family protein